MSYTSTTNNNEIIHLNHPEKKALFLQGFSACNKNHEKLLIIFLNFYLISIIQFLYWLLQEPQCDPHRFKGAVYKTSKYLELRSDWLHPHTKIKDPFIVVVFICNEGEKKWKIILNGRWLFHFSWSLIPIRLTQCSDNLDQLTIFIKIRQGWPTIPMNLTT